MKTCSKCKVLKELTDFYKEKNGAQGVKGKCKKCVEEVKKEWTIRNAAKILEKRRAREQQNSYKTKRKEYRVKNKEKTTLQNNNWRAAHQDEIRTYLATTREARNKRIRERYHSDVNYRLRRVLRTRLFHVLHSNKNQTSTFELTGCTTDYLKTHLESLFKPGMNWCNYGKDWHIDHIQPCRIFDFSKATSQRMCFHWTNLQPLWANENLTKGSSFAIDDEVLTSVYLLFGDCDY